MPLSLTKENLFNKNCTENLQVLHLMSKLFWTQLKKTTTIENSVKAKKNPPSESIQCTMNHHQKPSEIWFVISLFNTEHNSL